MPSSENSGMPKVSIPFTIIVSVIIAVAAWLFSYYQASASMGEKFVLKERYKCDIERIERGMGEISRKMDRVLWRMQNGHDD